MHVSLYPSSNLTLEPYADVLGICGSGALRSSDNMDVRFCVLYTDGEPMLRCCFVAVMLARVPSSSLMPTCTAGAPRISGIWYWHSVSITAQVRRSLDLMLVSGVL